MSLDIVRGFIKKIIPTKTLIQNLTEVFERNNYEGTLYLGYPLFASLDKKISLDALLISREFGLTTFIFPEKLDDIKNLKEKQDELYYQLEYNLKKSDNDNKLRKGRKLAFEPIIITLFPTNNIPVVENEYNFIVLEKIEETLNSLKQFDSSLYIILCEAIQKVSNIKPRKKRENVTKEESLGGKIKKIEKEIANLDHWQRKSAMEMPEGPQRIRGLAGSGKTIVLALKAAFLHWEHPNWKIAVTFYTRSLFQQYKFLIRQFYFDLSGEEPEWDNLNIMHAWGTNSEKGIYSSTALELGFTPYNYSSAVSKFGRKDTFNKICDELLTYFGLSNKSLFDAILIDEAQDMPSSFFKMAYNITTKEKRIIWAYDELQNLNDTAMPLLEEMFGKDENGNLKINLDSSQDEALRDIVLPICYRNPPWVLSMAHSLGFGIYRERLVQMFDDLKLWEQIGYRVKEGKLDYGSKVKLERKSEATPMYFNQLLSSNECVNSKVFNSVAEQYQWVAEEIKNNIENDELDPDDILVIFPDTYYSKSEYIELRQHLAAKGILSALSGVNTDKDTFKLTGNVICSSIHRAKGNEAPMVYVLNSDHCIEGVELIKLRNTLFTAITRSRGWVRICGVGSKMNLLEKEIQSCINNNFDLEFKVPTIEELKIIRKINRERTEKEIEEIKDTKNKVNEIMEKFGSGNIDIELVPELEALINMINKSKKSNSDDIK